MTFPACSICGSHDYAACYGPREYYCKECFKNVDYRPMTYYPPKWTKDKPVKQKKKETSSHEWF